MPQPQSCNGRTLYTRKPPLFNYNTPAYGACVDRVIIGYNIRNPGLARCAFSFPLSLSFFFLSPLLLFVLVARQHLADVGCARAHTLVHATTVHVSLCAGYCGYYIAINGTSQCNLQDPRLSSLLLPRSFSPFHSLSLFVTRALSRLIFKHQSRHFPAKRGAKRVLRLIVLCSRYIYIYIYLLYMRSGSSSDGVEEGE